MKNTIRELWNKYSSKRWVNDKKRTDKLKVSFWDYYRPKKEEQIEEGVRFSLRMPQNLFKEWVKGKSQPTFQEYLLFAIDEKGMEYPDFYKKAYMDRKLFWAIKNNIYYQPKKDTVISCCLALELNKYESDILMHSAGYELSFSIPRDKIFIFCIEKGIYDIDEINDFLYEMNEKLLRY